MAWERLKSLLSLPPVVFDGGLCLTIAAFGFLLGRFGTDDAAKWVPPQLLWWMLTVFGFGNALATALQFFRSKSFADHMKKKDETQTWEKRTPTP